MADSHEKPAAPGLSRPLEDLASLRDAGAELLRLLQGFVGLVGPASVVRDNRAAPSNSVASAGNAGQRS